MYGFLVMWFILGALCFVEHLNLQDLLIFHMFVLDQIIKPSTCAFLLMNSHSFRFPGVPSGLYMGKLLLALGALPYGAPRSLYMGSKTKCISPT